MAIIFAIKKFYRYLYGKEFTIVTDHQALCEIFKPSRKTTAVAAARLQRWSIILSMYQYKIVHKSGKNMGNVDGLSRLPLPDENREDETQIVNFLNFSDNLPITLDEIRNELKQDFNLSIIYMWIKYGFNCLKPSDKVIVKPLKHIQNSLSTDDGCVFYANRCRMLSWLHENHLGIVRMKMVARSYVWWPHIDKDIEHYAKSCSVCQGTYNIPKEIIKTKWHLCTYPLERVHIDFFHLNGNTFLLVVDAFSKYLDVKLMNKTDAKSVTSQLNNFFTVFGLAKTLVTDNGPPFSSYEFSEYCRRHDINLIHSPPYHPQSNGLAERNVQTVKTVLKRFLLSQNKNMSITDQINKFLFHHRNVPVMPTMKKPAELIFAYHQSTILDSVKPSNESVSRENESSLLNLTTNVNTKPNFFNVDRSVETKLNFKNDIVFKNKEHIYYRNHFKFIEKWIKAIYLKKMSATTHIILLNGNSRLVHSNQIRKINNFDKYPMSCPVSNKPIWAIPLNRQSINQREIIRRQPKPSNVTPAESNLKRRISPEESPEGRAEVRRSKRIKQLMEQQSYCPRYRF